MKKYPPNMPPKSKNMPFKISENYNLTHQEETNSINYINQLLKEFENQLDIISLETTWYSIMPLGRKICESMIKLLLKKEGYLVTEYSPFIEIIQFSFDHNIITRKYYNSLNKIRKQANVALHGDELKYRGGMSFLKEFSEFIRWFNRIFSENNENVFLIEKTTSNISSILKASTHYEKTINPLENHPTKSQYRFYKKEESEEIYEINNLLNDYKEQLQSISSEKKFYYTFLGSTISELMLKLLLKKEGYYNPDEHYRFHQYIEVLYEQDIIPKECSNFLQLIRRYRNEFIHGSQQSDKLIFSFLKALSYFMQWFDNYYYQKYQNKFQIEECCELINSLTYDEKNNTLTYAKTQEEQNLSIEKELELNDNIKIKKDILDFEEEIELDKYNYNIEPCEPYPEILPTNEEIELDDEGEIEPCEPYPEILPTNEEIELDEYEDEIGLCEPYPEIQSPPGEIEKLTEEFKQKEVQNQKEIKILNQQNKDILKKLDETNKQLEICMNILNELLTQGKTIEDKIDDIHLKINTISNQITDIQSTTERLIENAQSTEEIEKIIERYIDRCIDNIMNYYKNFTEDQIYKMEKTKLIYSIGDEGWNKMCEKSKTFLITSKVMYNHLITMEDIIDYSGICVLVTKALEVEIHKRFFTNFLDYLYIKYGTNYGKYHTALLYQKRKPLLSEKFTMGNIAFVMCYYENRYDTDDQKMNNKLKLIEYCKEYIFSNYNEDEIEELLTKYASSIEEIREKYRNPSAHTNEIKRVNAEECFNLVLDVEKLLKIMLDSFDS